MLSRVSALWISKIDILKDAAATAIYGVRANGVGGGDRKKG